jgi:hypothetical protein
MSAKVTLRWALLAIIFISLGIHTWKKSADQEAGAAIDAPTPGIEAAAVVVTYFTTDVRCDSCRTIEALSRRCVEEEFPDQLASGEVVFRVVNTDRDEHEHFVEHYDLTNKTVIVSSQVEGKESSWTDRQDVWLLLDEPDAFIAYVREPVQQYLANGDA